MGFEPMSPPIGRVLTTRRYINRCLNCLQAFSASVTFNILKRLQSLCFCCQVIPEVRFELTIWNVWSSRISLYASPAQNRSCRNRTHIKCFKGTCPTVERIGIKLFLIILIWAIHPTSNTLCVWAFVHFILSYLNDPASWNSNPNRMIHSHEH